jgi:thymidylate synthase ThyX
MMTQTPQPLTVFNGYCLPRLFSEANLESSYCRVMNQAAEVYQRLVRIHPQAAGYIVPNGFRRRVLLSANFRALDHFLALRTAPNAHFAVRLVAYRIADELTTQFPLLGKKLRAADIETWQGIEEEYFTRW